MLFIAGKACAKPGADYNLSHPFGSNKVPTDPREIGKRLSDVKSR